MGQWQSFSPMGVDRITGDAVGIDLSKARSTFSAVAPDLESPKVRHIYSLAWAIWMIPPRNRNKEKNFVLYGSVFESGYMVCGIWLNPKLCKAQLMSSNSSQLQKYLVLLSGIHPIRGHGGRASQEMPGMQNCNECQFRTKACKCLISSWRINHHGTLLHALVLCLHARDLQSCLVHCPISIFPISPDCPISSPLSILSRFSSNLSRRLCIFLLSVQTALNPFLFVQTALYLPRTSPDFPISSSYLS
jgi:hypothetical protein